MNSLVPVVKEYLESMERFCKRNFGTSNLKICRERLEQAYEEVWR